MATPYETLQTGDIIATFMAVMTEALGFWAYFIILILIDLPVILKSKSPALLIIINTAALSLIYTHLPAGVYKIMSIIIAVVITVMMIGVYEMVKDYGD